MNGQAILGNFALILFVLTIVTGVIWFLDVFYLAKQRRLKANTALADFDARNEKLRSEGIKLDESGRTALEANMLRQPTWVEYSGSFFPVIAVVFFVRSFLYEPFKIPSGSMEPTLIAGDFILVNKFAYGVRLPVLNKKVIEIDQPKRGDVMVFRFPKDPSTDYIKRVIGVPGDKIVYKNKRLTVNGQKLQYQNLPDYLDEADGASLAYRKRFKENLTGVQHDVLNYDDPDHPAYVRNPDNFPFREMCTYDAEGFTCSVPQGHYFMMGDNRDNSGDSRYWGFVPDENIVGKAFFVWMNFSDPKRIGSFK